MTIATESVNIAERMAAQAAAQPKGRALVFPERGGWITWTYAQLNAETDKLARGLRHIGIHRGMRTIVMVRPGPDFFALTFALFKLGAVPVLIDPGIGRKSLGRCIAEAKPKAFIGVPLAHAARVLLGWAGTARILVTAGPRLFWGGHTLGAVRRLGEGGGFEPASTSADDNAAILFTSGSTGVPKGAMYTHGVFSAQVAMLRNHFGIRPGEVDVPTFPLFALFAPALGMTAVIPEMDFTRPGSVEPENIIGAIQHFQATQMFGSPALLDRVGRYGSERGIQLTSLTRVISAGAPVSPRILERFAKLLPSEALIHTPYGATEALPVASITHKEVLGDTQRSTWQGKGVCIGRPLPGMEVTVIKLSDEAILKWSEDLLAAPDEVGEIAVKGPVVTKSYFGRPEATALAKIPHPDGSVTHRMGDLGYFDAAGRLWFCGRKSQRVITPQGTLFTIPVEGVFNKHPRVRRTALVGVGAAPDQRPVLCVELEPGHGVSEALIRELRELGAAHALTKGIEDILFHPGFPVDIRHNAKIFREQLANWAAGRLG